MSATRIRFDCELVTAAFVHGQSPDGPAELRLPSLRGLMRYWFRALAGGAVGLSALRNLEGVTFGTAAENGKSRSCPFVMRLTPARTSTEARSSLCPHKPPQEVQHYKKYAILPGDQGSFALSLRALPFGRDHARPALELAASAYWLAAHLGGLGGRSRRCAGSFAITSIDPAGDLPAPASTARDGTALAGVLGGGIRRLREDLPERLKAVLKSQEKGVTRLQGTKLEPPECSRGLPSFPVLHPSCAAIRIREVSDREEEAVRKRIMMLLKPQDHDRPWFGHGGRQRLASPVWFHAHRFPDGRFAIVATWMKTSDAPHPDRVHTFLRQEFPQEVKLS